MVEDAPIALVGMGRQKIICKAKLWTLAVHTDDADYLKRAGGHSLRIALSKSRGAIGLSK